MADKITWEYTVLRQLRDRIDPDEWRKWVFGQPVPHDEASCKALKEYDDYCNSYECQGKAAPNTGGNMQRIANKYGTTIENMKQHWHCVDPNMGKNKNPVT